MHLFRLEHSKWAYVADFVLYGLAVAVTATLLLLNSSHSSLLDIVVFAMAGFGSWSGIEYALHRFVLHGVEPFQRWHATHHDRPTALICSPTLLSASLVILLVFLPALFLWGLQRAGALTLGVTIGYLQYAITHHATHHWAATNAWAKNRKRWHALHHHTRHRGFYGVTTTFWDHVFGTSRGQE